MKRQIGLSFALVFLLGCTKGVPEFSLLGLASLSGPTFSGSDQTDITIFSPTAAVNFSGECDPRFQSIEWKYESSSWKSIESDSSASLIFDCENSSFSVSISDISQMLSFTAIGEVKTLHIRGNTVAGETKSSTINIKYASSTSISEANSLISVGSATITMGASTTVTLEARDNNDDPIVTGGEAVVFQITSGSGSATFSAVTDLGNGSYSATLTSTSTGVITVGATINGQSVTSTLPQVFILAPAALSLTPASWDFGEVEAVVGNATVGITVTNTGAVTATGLAGAGMATPFSFAGGSYPGGGTCGATLNPGATCTMVVDFSPSSTGVSNDTLELSYNNGVSAQTATLNLTGTGVTAPTVVNVTSPDSNGAYGLGSVLSIHVEFSAAVVVNTTGGTPALTLETGATDRTASYASGSGSTTLTFTYTVQSGDDSSDLDYPSTSALALNGGSISTSSGITANLTLPSPGTSGSLSSNKALVIDVVPPSAPAITGVTGGTDTDVDGFLEDGNVATVNWSDVADENEYWVTIYESDGVTVKCPATSVGANTTTFNTCNLDASTVYEAEVKAEDAAGNSATSTLFTFYVGVDTPAQITALDCFSSAYVGEVFGCSVTATGAEPIQTLSYSSSGTTCTWLSVNPSTGAISGTPADTHRGSCELHVQVSDGPSSSQVWKRSLYVYGGTDIADIGTGLAHSCAALNSKVKCWGNNTSGPLGNGSTSGVFSSPQEVSTLTSGVTQLALGGSHTCARVNGGAKCWGRNTEGQLGDGSTTVRTSPVNVTDLNTGVRKIAAGRFHTCALLDDRTVRCWGRNVEGQLGTGSFSTSETGPVDVSSLSDVVDISLGFYHSCALTSEGKMKCWGENTEGQLGLDTNVNQSVPTDVLTIGGADPRAMQISVGGEGTTTAAHSCAILENQELKCWGKNTYGQLGLGNTTSYGAGSPPMSSLDPVALGSGRTPKVIAAGGDFNCSLLDNGSVKCFGRGDTGQLGGGNTSSMGDNAGEMGDNLPSVDLGTGLSTRKISLGRNHGCGLFDAGGVDKVKCWGDNIGGQLGVGDTDDRGDSAGEMGDNLPFVDLSDPPSNHIVFVTSTTYNGNLGGLAGADASCQSHASTASLPNPSSFIALLGNSSIATSSRVNVVMPIENTNGEIIATSSADLWDSALANAIGYDEFGAPVSGSVWGSSWGNGTIVTGDPNQQCADWSSSSVTLWGWRGNSTSTDVNWVKSGQDRCNLLLRLYCISQ